MIDTVDILLSADENYARYCAVTVLSALSNMKEPDRAKLHLLSPDISAGSAEKLETLCSAFGATVAINFIDLNIFNGLPIKHKHFSLSTYSRLYGPKVCSHCDRLLYLDCDIIVMGDVTELFNSSLEGRPIAAVPHVSLPYQKDFVNRFPVKGSDLYFNAGVIVIDTRQWREDSTTDKILKVANAHSDKLEFADQDPLNVYFWGNYTHLPGMWNVESRLYGERLLGVPQDDAVKQRLQSPQIVHFTGAKKPWSSPQYVPMRHLYRHYSDRLATEFNWYSNTEEPKRCGFLPFTSFLGSCLYFRLAALKQRVWAKH